MSERTVVVTGASSGVGLAAAEQFARAGDHVVLVGRTTRRLDEAVRRVAAAGKAEPGRFQADFERLDDVRALAEHLLATYPDIDVLANNAGGMADSYRRTADGFEATMQGNHLAPFLLTGLLRERLAGGRVVNTASRAHQMGPRLDPAELVGTAEKYNTWQAYGESKAANILFTAEAARRWPDILSVSFHPGVVRSNFGVGALTRFFYRYAPGLTTPAKAGELLVWLATVAPGRLTSGGYYVGHELTRPTAHAADPLRAAALWEASEKAVG